MDAEGLPRDQFQSDRLLRSRKGKSQAAPGARLVERPWLGQTPSSRKLSQGRFLGQVSAKQSGSVWHPARFFCWMIAQSPLPVVSLQRIGQVECVAIWEGHVELEFSRAPYLSPCARRGLMTWGVSKQGNPQLGWVCCGLLFNPPPKKKERKIKQGGERVPSNKDGPTLQEPLQGAFLTLPEETKRFQISQPTNYLYGS